MQILERGQRSRFFLNFIDNDKCLAGNNPPTRSQLQKIDDRLCIEINVCKASPQCRILHQIKHNRISRILSARKFFH